jgi:hypothetical protein
MAFTGTGLVEEVSDGLVRVSGISIGPGAIGTIGLSSSLIPFHGMLPDIRLPARFMPDAYANVSLLSAIQVTCSVVFDGGADFVIPISVAKSGATPTNFLIAVANMNGAGASSFIGAAVPFGILGSTAVNNTGNTGITGDVGSWPGVVAGFPPGTASGTVHSGDATAQAAIRDATVGWAALSAITPTQNLSGQDLGGKTLPPGVYRFDGDATLTGTLTLDFQHDPNITFVIQVSGNLAVAGSGTVTIINDPDPNRIFWVVGDDATLGNSTDFRGTLIARNNVALTQSSTIIGGRAISLSGTVTLAATTVSIPTAEFFPAASGPLEIYVRFH